MKWTLEGEGESSGRAPKGQTEQHSEGVGPWMWNESAMPGSSKPVWLQQNA
jgi:hypothetical protein